MSLVTARGILLRSHPFGETSRVLRFLTDRRGVVGVMARGVRRAKGGAAGLDPFAEGTLVFHVKETRELQTFREFGVTRPRVGLGRDPLRLAAAGVLAELVLRHAGEAESGPLFDVVSSGLDAVSEAPPGQATTVLLREAWRLVDTLGFRPELDACVACGRPLRDAELGRMDYAQGGLRCESCSEGSVAPRVGPGAREQLRTLFSGSVPADLTRTRPHLQLLSDFVSFHLAGTRPLDAFRVLAALLPPDEPAPERDRHASPDHA